ncbi:MAG: IS256 family transposase, partial [Cumulibacter sp.]
MSAPTNAPSCAVCARKLVKNGTTSAGRTRWRCTCCGASSTRARSDITRRAQLTRFLAWLLQGRRPADLASSARTFRRDTAWCWRIQIPPPSPPRAAVPVVLLDGTYFQSW